MAVHTPVPWLSTEHEVQRTEYAGLSFCGDERTQGRSLQLVRGFLLAALFMGNSLPTTTLGWIEQFQFESHDVALPAHEASRLWDTQLTQTLSGTSDANVTLFSSLRHSTRDESTLSSIRRSMSFTTVLARSRTAGSSPNLPSATRAPRSVPLDQLSPLLLAAAQRIAEQFLHLNARHLVKLQHDLGSAKFNECLASLKQLVVVEIMAQTNVSAFLAAARSRPDSTPNTAASASTNGRIGNQRAEGIVLSLCVSVWWCWG